MTSTRAQNVRKVTQVVGFSLLGLSAAVALLALLSELVFGWDQSTLVGGTSFPSLKLGTLVSSLLSLAVISATAAGSVALFGWRLERSVVRGFGQTTTTRNDGRSPAVIRRNLWILSAIFGLIAVAALVGIMTVGARVDWDLNVLVKEGRRAMTLGGALVYVIGGAVVSGLVSFFFARRALVISDVSEEGADD